MDHLSLSPTPFVSSLRAGSRSNFSTYSQNLAHSSYSVRTHWIWVKESITSFGPDNNSVYRQSNNYLQFRKCGLETQRLNTIFPWPDAAPTEPLVLMSHPQMTHPHVAFRMATTGRGSMNPSQALFRGAGNREKNSTWICSKKCICVWSSQFQNLNAWVPYPRIWMSRDSLNP